jgi:hypothetical protein
MRRDVHRQAAGSAALWLTGIVLWGGAFLFAFTTVLHNDHFDRIVHARQVARYGELPFRDFLDPGYFMTEFASAGLQLLLGDRLLGDLLMDASFIATGIVIVLLLARRISGSLVVACAAALLALLSVPRLYDFDKVLFYPLGVLLCWRYIDRATPARLAALGGGVVAGALFRYDTGLYIGASAVIAVVVVHWRDWTLATRRLALLAAAVALAASPFLLFVQLTGGLLNAADQIVAYAIREGARTRISSPPRFSFDDPAPPVRDPAAPPVRIRWAASVDEAQRRELAERHGLREEAVAGEPGERTWSYRLDDASAENIRGLLSDPRVEDTHGIDRSLTVVAEPAATPGAIVERWLGVRLPGVWTTANASAFVYYLLFALPALGVIALLPPGTAGGAPQSARILSLAVMCLALDVFILRDPVYARLGGMAGPAAVMAAWVSSRVWKTRNVVARVLLVPALAATVWAVSATADWQTELRSDRMSWERVRSHYLAYATTAGETVPTGPWLGMVRYLRECTNPDDRVYASWFVPELYFYAQRGFAAGVSVTFGGHWSEPRYQERMVGILSAQQAPILLVQAGSYDDFQNTFRAFNDYLQKRYQVAGETSFGDSGAPAGAYLVLTDRSRVPSGTHTESSMPCFR